MEEPAHISIVSLVRHPDTDRYDEAQFLSERDLIRQDLRRRRTESHLVLLLVDLEPCRHPGCDIKDPSVCQRHTDLKPGSCAHLVHVQVDIPFQPDLDIHIRHLCQRVKSLCLLINVLYQLDRQHIRVVFLKDLLFLILLHDVRVAHIEGLEVIPIALRVAVHVVSAEELVRALSGVAQFRVLCRRVAGNGKGDRRRIAQRLLHVVHHIRNDLEILLRCDQASGILASQDIRRLLRQTGLVKACLLVPAGIRHLHI